MRRCYCEDSLDALAPGGRLTLSASEAHHLRDVLRVAAGSRVEVFDGRGWSATAVVESVSRKAVVLTLVEPPGCASLRRPQLWLGFAPPKLDRLRWAVEKSVELGVDRLILLATRHTVVDPGEGKLRKLADAAIQACKQCGRSDLPQIVPAQAWDAFLTDWTGAAPAAASQAEAHPGSSPPPSRQLFVADPGGAPLLALLGALETAPPAIICCLIGPEGGLTPDELQNARTAGACAVRLGEQTLRIETAALAAAACVRAWSDLHASRWLHAPPRATATT